MFSNLRVRAGTLLLLLLPWIPPCPSASAAGPERVRKVLVLFAYEKDLPANLVIDESIRATFKANSNEPIELFSEYMDLGRFGDARYEQQLVEHYRQKYARHEIEVVIPVILPALDFAQKHRDQLFPGRPIVYCALYKKELLTRNIGPKVIGVPVDVEMNATLDLALQLHPNTQRVVIVAGASENDASWVHLARQNFRQEEEKGNVEFVYLTGLPMTDLLDQVAHLPKKSIVLYINIVRDGEGKPFRPRDALELLSQASKVPVYGFYDTYLGHGIVGGRLLSMEAEGKNAANLGLRILVGEKPEDISVGVESSNAYMFDGRQLRRFGIREDDLPPGSIVRYREPTAWELYQWYILGGIFISIIEGLLIAGLLVQRAKRRRAEEALRESRNDLRSLTGRLLQAQELERRRLAREMHDDMTQRLAVLAIEMGKIEHAQGPNDPLTEKLADMRHKLVKLSEDVHALSRQLHPSILDDLGLIDALRSECISFQQREGIVVEYRPENVPANMPKDVALCVYRITQEALRNIAKHAQTKEAQVALVGNGKDVLLTVTDLGNGFDFNAVRSGPGLGLASIHERARLINAELSIQSRPGLGTTIGMLVPLPKGVP